MICPIFRSSLKQMLEVMTRPCLAELKDCMEVLSGQWVDESVDSIGSGHPHLVPNKGYIGQYKGAWQVAGDVLPLPLPS